MKRIVFGFAVLLAGCVVQSFHPFCLDQSLCLPAGVTGSWQLQKDFGNDVSTNKITAWQIEGNAMTNLTLVAYDKNNLGAKFAARFFKLGEVLFLDVLPQDTANRPQLNDYSAWTLRGVHAVAKVELTGDRMTLKLLDYDWLKEKVQKRKVSLPYLGTFDDMPLFTATSKQWEAFLRKHAKDPGAFPDEHAFVLNRVPAEK